MTVKFLLANANFFYYISFPKTREKKKDRPRKKKKKTKRSRTIVITKWRPRQLQCLDRRERKGVTGTLLNFLMPPIMYMLQP